MFLLHYTVFGLGLLRFCILCINAELWRRLTPLLLGTQTKVVSFFFDLLPTFFAPSNGSTVPLLGLLLTPFYRRPLWAGTRRSLFGEVSALGDMSPKPPTCRRPTLNRPATGLRPAAVGRLRGLFGHLGALTSCA